ncbi:amidohydrolase family protein [Sphingomonas sp. PP-CC-3G-468]|uniref:metal-dependent hydrolase family protein n=1 Tax=Sphingomonas sp. PP-CC-3G-468 TaxID=2135656 RepID=UPI00104C70B1|nr:amidohydrolase family protein [Sphingomonas sp. PP-CC-3G-468]TCM02904.1 imidazolonepropionase-like amidohydrolase [Sphingomonas sp. PP-CC-3G-468]
MLLLLKGCRVFDGVCDDVADNQSIYIEDGIIREVGERVAASAAATVIDVGGRFVMPGLIDAHFHAYGVEVNPALIDRIPPVVLGIRAKAILEATLARGFTTVRDAAGADYALASALKTGLIHGPRLFYAGMALSQTGGHGDLRSPDHHDICACAYCGALSMVVDGVDEVRRAVREQLRRGAHQIKLFVSGGVLSPSDPIWMNQFADDEIRVAVAEAATRRCYVMAHAHTNEAAIRCVINGVRSVEHATMLEADGVAAIVAAGAYAVPTLAIIDAIQDMGPKLGLSQVMADKTREVAGHALTSLDRLRGAGANIGFGTDLLGSLMDRQTREFSLRREVCSPLEILRQATSVNAALLQMAGKLGTIAPDAFADLLVIEGDPLADIAVLGDTSSIRLILQDGRIRKNTLDA